GFSDVWAAANESADLLNNGMVNLNDPAARYEFWKSKGIYDKYNAGERAFLNQVVMPAVAVAQWALGGLAGSLTGVGVAFGLASLLGLALGPGVLIAGGIALGLTAVALIGHFKGKAVREEEGDINALTIRLKSLTESFFFKRMREADAELGIDYEVSPEDLQYPVPVWNGWFPVAGVLGTAAGLAGGVGGAVTGYLTTQQEYNILAT
ncbi:MAG: hypothetical protein H5T71_06845, partial [Chloroflexi bacterium]|nr:hypothetical protein [Chloroflexota bacterium]